MYEKRRKVNRQVMFNLTMIETEIRGLEPKSRGYLSSVADFDVGYTEKFH
jgi:hypothetical protein